MDGLEEDVDVEWLINDGDALVPQVLFLFPRIQNVSSTDNDGNVFGGLISLEFLEKRETVCLALKPDIQDDQIGVSRFYLCHFTGHSGADNVIPLNLEERLEHPKSD